MSDPQKPSHQTTLAELELRDAISAAMYHLTEAPEPDGERIRRAVEILTPFDRVAAKP